MIASRLARLAVSLPRHFSTVDRQLSFLQQSHHRYVPEGFFMFSLASKWW